MNADATTLRIRPAPAATSQDWSVIARSAAYHFKTALIVFAAVLLIGIALTLLMPAKYRSEARLLTLPADYYSVRGRDKGDASAEAFKPEQLASVEMQLLSSEDLQREVLLRSGMRSQDAEAFEKARQALAKNLTIARVEGANVIELGYTAGSPREAATRLQTLLDAYFDLRARVLASGRSDPIARERQLAARELEAADTALRRFQERNGIADIDAQVNGAVAIDTALRQDLAVTHADLSETRGNVSQLRNASGRVPQTVELFRDDSEATKAIADMQSQILVLEAKRADLEGRYMQGSPLIEQVDKQIGGLRAAITKQSGQLREARRMGRNSYYDAATDRIMQIDAAASGQAAKLGRLGAELSGSQLRLRNLNEIAATIAGMRTQRQVAEERFRNLTKQLEDARASELEARTGSTNVRVIQRPSLPDGRMNSPAMLLVGSVIAALAVAAAALFVLIVRRDTFLDASEVTRSLKLPVALDLTRSERGGVRRLAQLPVTLGSPLPARGRVLGLIGAEPAAYGSELTALSRSLETRGGSVATVMFEEAAYRFDERKPLSGMLPRPGDRGHVKVGSLAWTIDRTGETLLASLRETFRWTVLLLPPPEAAAPDGTNHDPAFEAAALADEVLLIVRLEVTSRAAAERLVAEMLALNVPVRGIVLAGRRMTPPRLLASARS